MEEIEGLVRVGEAVAGGAEPGAALRAAWEQLVAVAGGREAWLEVRVGGRVRTFGERRPAAGDEVFPLGGGMAPGKLIVGRSVAGRERALGARERRALKVGAALVGLFVENAELARQVAAGSGGDALSGCLRRREGMERIGAELRRVRERGCGASLIFLDLDHLKGLNDRYGHGFGDAALAAVGAVLRDSLRGGDVRCRYGGDEFVVLLPETPVEGALRVAEKVRGELARRGLPGAGGAVVVAASFGVSTTLSGEEDAGALVARADAAMYRAKRAGGNAVRVWRQEPEWRRAAGGVVAGGPVAGCQESAPQNGADFREGWLGGKRSRGRRFPG